MLAEIQVSPRPAGDQNGQHSHVDAALELIQRSGLTYEVHALGTIVEGSPEEVWSLLRAVHEIPLADGAQATASSIKVHQGRDDNGDTTPSIADLVTRWRR